MLRSALFGFKLGRRSLDIACGEAGFQISGHIHYAEFQILAWKIGELCLQASASVFLYTNTKRTKLRTRRAIIIFLVK